VRDFHTQSCNYSAVELQNKPMYSCKEGYGGGGGSIDQRNYEVGQLHKLLVDYSIYNEQGTLPSLILKKLTRDSSIHNRMQRTG
jgi:hypothetical protein